MVNRNLIDYLPMYVQDFVEIQKIMTAEQPESNDIWSSVNNTFNDQFIMDATENGVSRWEHMLDITPKSTDTLDERKYRIITRLNQELPYTLRRLNEVLTFLCGAGGYSIELITSDYSITIKLALTNKNNYSDVESLLNKMIPANLVKAIQIMYNSHEVLSAYTHQELSAYTHQELREEVIE